MKRIALLIILISLIGCKPEMPSIKNYDNIPCYLADVCLTVNAYMVNNKTDCTIALQKCYKYSDYDKCRKETTEEEKAKCRKSIVIEY